VLDLKFGVGVPVVCLLGFCWGLAFGVVEMENCVVVFTPNAIGSTAVRVPAAEIDNSLLQTAASSYVVIVISANCLLLLLLLLNAQRRILGLDAFALPFASPLGGNGGGSILFGVEFSLISWFSTPNGLNLFGVAVAVAVGPINGGGGVGGGGGKSVYDMVEGGLA